MKQIPTAEEFMKIPYSHGNEKYRLIEFAKLHVEAALKEASEKSFAESTSSNISSKDNKLTCIHLGRVYVNKESILNAYPLTNIK